MAESKYKKDLEDFKRRVVQAVRDYQPDYDLCEDGVKDFFSSLGLTSIDDEISKNRVVVTFNLRGSDSRDITESDLTGFFAGHAFLGKLRYELGDNLYVDEVETSFK